MSELRTVSPDSSCKREQSIKLAPMLCTHLL